MSDTTGWSKTDGWVSWRLYKNLPHCRIQVERLSAKWEVKIELTDNDRPTRAEAQRLAHALARALEDVTDE